MRAGRGEGQDDGEQEGSPGQAAVPTLRCRTRTQRCRFALVLRPSQSPSAGQRPVGALLPGGTGLQQ